MLLEDMYMLYIYTYIIDILLSSKLQVYSIQDPKLCTIYIVSEINKTNKTHY